MSVVPNLPHQTDTAQRIEPTDRPIGTREPRGFSLAYA